MWPFSKGANEEKQRKLELYESDKLRMRSPVLVDQNDDLLYYRRIAQILNDQGGKIAVRIAQGYNCSAVHEITGRGAFSKSGPYWTKKVWVGNPRRFAICVFAVSKAPAGIRNPNSEIRSYGIQIDEMDTDLLPMMEFSEWELFTGKI